MCKCVLYFCHRVTIQLQLTNISHHIIKFLCSLSAVFNNDMICSCDTTVWLPIWTVSPQYHITLHLFAFVACCRVKFTFTLTLHTSFHSVFSIYHFYCILRTVVPLQNIISYDFIKYSDVKALTFISPLQCLELINLRLKGFYPPTTGTNRHIHRLFVWWMEFWYAVETSLTFYGYVFAQLPH